MPVLQRLAQFFGRPPADPAAASLYHACMAQARREEFYRLWGVPDTVDGRFDLLVLHVFLVLRRMGGEAEAKQRLFDLMFADMDRSLREMGVGDMGMARRMKAMISAFYGRAQAYENALAAGGEALAEVLARNLYGKTPPAPGQLQKMAGYTRAAADALERQPVADVLAGRVEFPLPDSI